MEAIHGDVGAVKQVQIVAGSGIDRAVPGRTYIRNPLRCGPGIQRLDQLDIKPFCHLTRVTRLEWKDRLLVIELEQATEPDAESSSTASAGTSCELDPKATVTIDGDVLFEPKVKTKFDF